MKLPAIKILEWSVNALEIFSISAVLLMAFAFQIILQELPCPLCLLQRLGFLGIAYGFLLNLRFGLRPSHYGIVILSALFTCFVALRQIALHVVPGTGAYGTAIFGLHFYTWSFIVAMLIIIATTIMLSVDRQYQPVSKKNKRWPKLTKVLYVLMLLLTLANIVSIYLECGFGQCPDNPMRYKYAVQDSRDKVIL